MTDPNLFFIDASCNTQNEITLYHAPYAHGFTNKHWDKNMFKINKLKMYYDEATPMKDAYIKGRLLHLTGQNIIAHLYGAQKTKFGPKAISFNGVRYSIEIINPHHLIINLDARCFGKTGAVKVDESIQNILGNVFPISTNISLIQLAILNYIYNTCIYDIKILNKIYKKLTRLKKPTEGLLYLHSLKYTIRISLSDTKEMVRLRKFLKYFIKTTKGLINEFSDLIFTRGRHNDDLIENKFKQIRIIFNSLKIKPLLQAFETYKHNASSKQREEVFKNFYSLVIKEEQKLEHACLLT